jgi:RNA polymerase sigma-70 factor (ECF subfamily)
MDLKENILINLAKNGDKEAFVSLIKNVEKRLFKIAYTICPEEAEDILQETYLEAYLGIKRFKGNSSFYTWIYRIMMNTIYKRNRKKSIQVKLQKIIPQNDEELKEIIRSALKKLPPKYNEVLTLFYFEGCSIKEISEILNIREGTVKSRLFKAKKILKKFVDKK